MVPTNQNWKKETEFALPEIKFANDGFNWSLYCPSEVKGFIDNFFFSESSKEIFECTTIVLLHFSWRYVLQGTWKNEQKFAFRMSFSFKVNTMKSSWSFQSCRVEQIVMNAQCAFLRRIEHFLDEGNNHWTCDSVTVINTSHCYRKRHSGSVIGIKSF